MIGVTMAFSENPIDKANDLKFSTTSGLSSGFRPKAYIEDSQMSSVGQEV